MERGPHLQGSWPSFPVSPHAPRNTVRTGLPTRAAFGTVDRVSPVRVQRKIPTPSPIDAAMPVVALAAVSAPLASALGFGLPVRLSVPLVFVVIASKRTFDASIRRARLRMLADHWLGKSVALNPDAFAWRVDELLGSERKAIARVLDSYAAEVMRPRRPGAPRLNRQALRRDADLIATVAGALHDRRCLSPRAVVRAQNLVTDPGSPLNSSARHAELREALEQILADAAYTDGWKPLTVHERRAHRSRTMLV